jgi:hypothetical protein
VTYTGPCALACDPLPNVWGAYVGCRAFVWDGSIWDWDPLQVFPGAVTVFLAAE